MSHGRPQHTAQIFTRAKVERKVFRLRGTGIKNRKAKSLALLVSFVVKSSLNLKQGHGLAHRNRKYYVLFDRSGSGASWSLQKLTRYLTAIKLCRCWLSSLPSAN